jgi:hypothetical protein
VSTITPDEAYAAAGQSFNDARHIAPRDTGFSVAVKLAVRTRAGNGDPFGACCEACGCFLGRYGGQVHHRMNRQSGGSKLRNGIQNAALLCGTPDDYATCHGKATRLDERMNAAGFWLSSKEDPREVPLVFHHMSGCVAWLTQNGDYSVTPPEGKTA